MERTDVTGAASGIAQVDEVSEPAEHLTPEHRVERVDQVLDEVEDALARLDDGTYGQCESCGAVIDDSRLAAEPVARECADCAPTGDA